MPSFICTLLIAFPCSQLTMIGLLDKLFGLEARPRAPEISFHDVLEGEVESSAQEVGEAKLRFIGVSGGGNSTSRTASKRTIIAVMTANMDNMAIIV